MGIVGRPLHARPKAADRFDASAEVPLADSRSLTPLSSS
jgi:hypothetical protein